MPDSLIPFLDILHTVIPWLLGILVASLAIVAGGHALLTKRDPRAAWGWIAVCVLFPLAGPVLYVIFGINRITTLARELVPDMDNGVRSAGSDEALLREALQRGDGRRAPLPISEATSRWPLCAGNHVEPLYNGEQVYPAMLQAIAAAQERVWLSSYIFRNDAIGRQFVTALREARERGVSVRILIDGVGEYYSLPRIGRRLRRAGLPFARFLPPRLIPPSLHINLRNHRKLLIVDRHIAFTGGINIGAHHMLEQKHKRATRDLHFCMQGPVVAQLGLAFAQDWHYAKGETLEVSAPESHTGDALCRVITDGPNEDFDHLRTILFSAMTAAQTRIWIVTPYFLPFNEFISAMNTAALRGVDVAVILPSDNNQPLAHWASRNMLDQLLEQGVNIYYRPAPFAHDKLFLLDDDYTLIGSTNMDPRSLRLNFEIGVEIYDREFSTIMQKYFTSVRSDSHAVSLNEMRQRSLPVRLRDAACWLFSPYL